MPSPIKLTEVGKITEMREVHSLKALDPRVPTEVGMTTEVREVQM
jgi:hypothetical protein